MRWPRYISAAQRRKKAKKNIDRFQKTDPNLQPVIIEGRLIANTWWGKSWNKNLESYADYSNRIGRGRTYVRQNAVVDLQIKPGSIDARVMGSRSQPYKITIKIKPINKDTWKNIQMSCQKELDSIQELLQGKFPESLSTIFTDHQSGLFPSPDEISFNCSCPDWADMCKHIAATLYGIGSRLDTNPELFFTLRKVQMKDLISGSVKKHKDTLLKKARIKTAKVMDDTNLSEIFGIDLDTTVSLPKKKQKKTIKKQAKKLGQMKRKISKKSPKKSR